MQREAVEEKVYSILSSILNVSRESLSLTTSRKTLEEWDSLKHIHLMLAIEEDLGIEFTDTEIAGLSSVSSLVDTLMAKTSSNDGR